MKLLLVAALVFCTAALPLDDDLLELSGIIVAIQDDTRDANILLEGSGLVDEDLEGSGEDDTGPEGSGTTEPEDVPATVLALAASEEVSVQARAATESLDSQPISNITQISSQTFENNSGNFSYGYSTSDGTSVETVGQQKRIGDGVGTVMRGSYSYRAPGGQRVTITWVADERGFRAFGDAVPTPPSYVKSLLEQTVAEADESVKPAVEKSAAKELRQAAKSSDAVEDVAFADEDSFDIVLEDDDDLEEDSTVSVANSDVDSAASTDVLSVAGNAPVAVEELVAFEEGGEPTLADVEELVSAVNVLVSSDDAEDGFDAGTESEFIPVNISPVTTGESLPADPAVNASAEIEHSMTTITTAEEDSSSPAETQPSDDDEAAAEDTSAASDTALGALELLARFS